MQRLCSWLVALGVLMLLLATPMVEARRPPGAKDKEKDLDKNSTKLIKTGLVVGKVRNVYESTKKVRMEITFSVPKFNQSAYNAMIQAQVAYQQALARRDFNGARNQQMSMIRQQANLYTYENKTQDIEVTATDEVEVRNLKRPEKFDEKGKVIKKFSKEELKELKGNPKLPGWKAEFSDIQPEQIIQVQLVRKKGARPTPAPKRKGKKDDEDLDVLADNLPKTSMIVIVRDPAAVPAPR